MKPTVYSQFRVELEGLLRKYEMGKVSNTSDHVLACFLSDCIDAWDRRTCERDRENEFNRKLMKEIKS